MIPGWVFEVFYLCCILAVCGVLIWLAVSLARDRRRPMKLVPGERLTPGDVEEIAMRRHTDADVVRLAMDWRAMREEHERDIAMLELELTDALSKAPAPMRGQVTVRGGDA